MQFHAMCDLVQLDSDGTDSITETSG